MHQDLKVPTVQTVVKKCIYFASTCQFQENEIQAWKRKYNDLVCKIFNENCCKCQEPTHSNKKLKLFLTLICVAAFWRTPRNVLPHLKWVLL